MRVNAAVRRDRSRFKQITSTNVGWAANYWYGRKKNDAPTAIAPAAIASGAARRKYPDRRSQSRSEKRRAKIWYYSRETALGGDAVTWLTAQKTRGADLLGLVYLISEKDLIRNPGNQERAECSRGIV